MKDKFTKWFKKYGSPLVGVIVALAIISMFIRSVQDELSDFKNDDIEIVTYPDFEILLENGNIDTVYYNYSEEYMYFTLFNEETKDMTEEEKNEYEYSLEDKRRVLYPAYDEFRKDILSYGVNLSIVKDNVNLNALISTLVTLAFPLLCLFMIFRVFSQQTKGLDAKSLIQKSDVTFDNVIGQDEVIDDVKFITKLLTNSDLGEEIGAKIPKGILLSGEPGTGKTLIAKAIAGEANVPFIYVNSSSLIEMFVGIGAKRVRDVFKIARQNSPCIVFFDEIDSIGIKRDTRGSNTENEQTINALLQEMDGFNGREGVFIIAATNRVDKLDSALIRAGRFDRQISVMPPRDWKVRAELFKFYLSKFKVTDDVDIENISRQVSGFTGADISAVCNEASLIAVMQGKNSIDMECMEEAIDKKIFHGNRSKREQHEEDKRVVCIHEGGHALCHLLLGEPITRASIQGMVSGVGGVVFGEDADSQFRTRTFYENRIMICYAGRVAESIKFDSITQGASSDIAQATNLLYEYIAKLGYDEEFGLLNLDVLSEKQLMTDSHIFDLMQKKSKELYQKTEDLIKEHTDMLEKIAGELYDKETLTGDEIKAIFNFTKE